MTLKSLPEKRAGKFVELPIAHPRIVLKFCMVHDARVLLIIVDVLCNWYSKLYYAVRWNSALSAQFAVFSGVRQGSCLFLLYLMCS